MKAPRRTKNPSSNATETRASRSTSLNTALIEIIRRAFGVVEQELAGVSNWTREQRFDIIGKSAAPATDAELWSMVRPLLEERFKLKYHREPRRGPRL